MKDLFYPFNILNEEIFPIFNKQVKGFPHYINLSESTYLPYKEANEFRFNEIKKANKEWGFSGYLENRKNQLLTKKQMMEEERFYHLGLDLHVWLGTELYAPLTGKVVISEYEEGDGNYGGMVVLKHDINGTIFYSLYGHLNKTELPKLNSIINKGEKFAKIGDFNENGGWAYHTHLQVLTEEGYNNGWVSKGYCSGKDIVNIDKFCPNPIFLLRF